MNDLGQVIGQTSSGATLWNGSTAYLLSNPVHSGAHAINDAGLVAGDALQNNSHFIPVLWNGSTQTPLQVGASGYGEANGINASGRAVGFAQLNNGATYGVLWNGSGNGTLLSTLGGGMSNPFAIDDAGVIDGRSTDTKGYGVVTMCGHCRPGCRGWPACRNSSPTWRGTASSPTRARPADTALHINTGHASWFGFLKAATTDKANNTVNAM